MEKQILNKLTELCNLIDSEKIILCYGDFLLETLYYGLNHFKLSKYPIKLVYLDALKEKPSQILISACNTASLMKNELIYIIDNIEALNKKEIDFLIGFKAEIKNSSKSIILCSLVLNEKITGIKKIKLGEIYSDEISLSTAVLNLMCNPDRKKVLSIFESVEYSLQYLLSLLSYNIHFFYKESGIFMNLKVIEIAQTFLYKVSEPIFYQYLIYNWKVSNVRKSIRYPPKKEVKKE